MTFAYTAVEPSGKKKSGVIDANSEEAAIALVATDGKFVLEIKKQEPKAGSIKGKQGVSRSELALFTRRLADLSAAGLPLDRVIQVIAEQSESSTLTAVCNEVLESVRAGNSVSDSLAQHPKLFPTIFTQTLKAGEASGQFPEVAQRLAEFQERSVTRRGSITSALIYPAILACAAVGVVIFMLTFVVPKLSPIFDKLGSDLPATTKILLAATGFLTQRGLVLAIVLFIAGFAFRQWIRTPGGALARDRFLLNMPILGPLFLKSTVSQYSRILGTLVFGGVPILEALELAGRASGNLVFQKSGEQVQAEVREGRPIAAAMRDTGSFPPVLTNMVAVGEETGNLPLMLNRVSDSLDFEVDNGMRRVTSLVEPIIVICMGCIVGFIIVSVLLPIYQAQDTVN